ncbi:hypothetical protein BJV78DRAFT_1256254 [Lactifluus subvellereus]|nr:hypothetical protein BJV78DRAFT_1256254 [Lactifluus subvellereus]
MMRRRGPGRRSNLEISVTESNHHSRQRDPIRVHSPGRSPANLEAGPSSAPLLSSR